MISVQSIIAATGGHPAFAAPIPAARNAFPAWTEVETAVDGIWSRRYFANHGPLVQELDLAFAAKVGARHAVCVANRTVAFMVAAAALERRGEAIMPALAPRYLGPAVRWAGWTPRFCDVDAASGCLTVESIERALTPETVAVVAPRLWGFAGCAEELSAWSMERGVSLVLDASTALGGAGRGASVGSLGTAEVFAFDNDSMVNGGDGGCITTGDSGLAAKMRAIRHFFPVDIRLPLRMNGKMSEIQAALALIGIKQLESEVASNWERHQRYARDLSGLPGISMIVPPAGERCNFQCVGIEVDESAAGVPRDFVRAVLKAHNVETDVPYEVDGSAGNMPRSREYARRILRLPNSPALTLHEIAKICEIVRRGLEAAPALIRGTNV